MHNYYVCSFWSDIHQVGEELLPKFHWSSASLLWKSWGNPMEHPRRISRKICLPDDPEYANETSGLSISEHSTVYGVEYQLPSGPNTNVYEHNAPCAVCFVPKRATAIVVPAKTTCPSSWTREYYGYLMTEADSTIHYRSVYNCLDGSPDVVPGSATNDHIALFHYAVTGCTGLSCPPYESGRILSCVVCTK